MSRSKERRSSPRVAFKVPARIYVGPEQTLHRGYIMNLSENGAFLMVEKGVSLGEVGLDFEPAPGESCQAIGRVAYASDMGAYQGMGIDLTQVNDSYVDFVNKLAAASSTRLMNMVDSIVRINVRGW